MTIGRARFELWPDAAMPKNPVVSEKIKRRDELLEIVCFKNRLTKQQLVDAPVERVSAMIAAVNPSLRFHLGFLAAMIKEYSKG